MIITQLSPLLRRKAQYLFCMQLKVGCAEIIGHSIKESCKCWLNIFVDEVELKYYTLKKISNLLQEKIFAEVQGSSQEQMKLQLLERNAIGKQLNALHGGK